MIGIVRFVYIFVKDSSQLLLQEARKLDVVEQPQNDLAYCDLVRGFIALRFMEWPEKS